MIYFIYALIFMIFIFLSFRLYKFLLKSTDVMKYMFYILAYIVGILISFQVLEKLLKHIYNPIPEKEQNFMFLVYLLASMIGFLSVAIITIKKLKKK